MIQSPTNSVKHKRNSSKPSGSSSSQVIGKKYHSSGISQLINSRRTILFMQKYDPSSGEFRKNFNTKIRNKCKLMYLNKCKCKRSMSKCPNSNKWLCKCRLRMSKCLSSNRCTCKCSSSRCKRIIPCLSSRCNLTTRCLNSNSGQKCKCLQINNSR